MKKELMGALADNLDKALDDASGVLSTVLDDYMTTRVAESLERFARNLRLSVSTKRPVKDTDGNA